MSTNDHDSNSLGTSHGGKEGGSQPYDDADRTNLRKATTTEAERKKGVASLERPLAGKPYEVLRRMGREYAIKNQLGEDEDIRAFEIGACLAQDPNKYDRVPGIQPDELEVLQKEITHRWSQPKLMYLIIVLCSTCAAVQGMGKVTVLFFQLLKACSFAVDETVVNGAQLFYRFQFGIDVRDEPRSTWLTGLLNSAPYLCCAFIGCWLTVPFNNIFGKIQAQNFWVTSFERYSLPAEMLSIVCIFQSHC